MENHCTCFDNDDFGSISYYSHIEVFLRNTMIIPGDALIYATIHSSTSHN